MAQLLFSTLHTTGAAGTVDRIIDAFPASQQRQIRMQLSMVLQAIVSQQLVPTVDGEVVPAFEIMVTNTAIRNLIREEKTHQLDSVMAAGSAEGMRTMGGGHVRRCVQRHREERARGQGDGAAVQHPPGSAQEALRSREPVRALTVCRSAPNPRQQGPAVQNCGAFSFLCANATRGARRRASPLPARPAPARAVLISRCRRPCPQTPRLPFYAAPGSTNSACLPVSSAAQSLALFLHARQDGAREATEINRHLELLQSPPVVTATMRPPQRTSILSKSSS